MRPLTKFFIIAVFGYVAFAISGNPAFAANTARFDISQYGAVADGATVNTKAIQAAIDKCAAGGGGTLVVPKGEFLSGSLFLKPGVNVELQEGAVLKNSPNILDFEIRPGVRFEGHFAEWRTGLLNAEHTNGLRITGPGVLHGNVGSIGNGWPAQGKPRLCLIRDSSNVVVSGVKFMSSASWNLHFYNCKGVTVENSRFEILDTERAPSSDGIDVDGSQNVTIRSCFFSVNDDCIAIKGNRYDGLDQEPRTTGSSNVRVSDCTFRRGHGALTLGTENVQVHDIEMWNCTVTGDMPMLRLKMRPDTPGQDYQNIRVHDIKLDGRGALFSFSLMQGTKAEPRPPRAIIRNISITNISGSFGSFGTIANNPNTDISDISLKNIKVTLERPQLNSTGVTGLKFENVVVNGSPVTGPAPITKS